MNQKATNDRMVFLEEVFDSIFNGIEFETYECSEENRFRTFVLPDGDRIVVCFANPYNMNRYEIPHWWDVSNEKESMPQNETKKRRRTRVFIHGGHSGMYEIEEYTEDHVWLINQTNMELWNHQTHQLAKTIDMKEDMMKHKDFIYFMKNGNIAVFNECLSVYDPTRARGKECVQKHFLFQLVQIINIDVKLAIETTENEFYFMFKFYNAFEHCLFYLGEIQQNHSRKFCIPIETKDVDRCVCEENRESGSLEECVSKRLMNDRDQRVLETFQCFVHRKKRNTYGLYEWSSGRTFYSDEIKSKHRRIDFSAFDGLNFGNADLFVVSMGRRTESAVVPSTTQEEDDINYLYSMFAGGHVENTSPIKEKNELWLMSRSDFNIERVHRINLGANDFKIMIVDATTILCVLMHSDEQQSTTRVFKIRSR